MQMKIVFATGNMGKLREAQGILGEGFELVTPAQIGLLEDIPETGDTLQANSLIKAKYIYDHTGCNCFADDTGLEVDALGGAPGVHTARYAGESKDPGANMDRLLSELEGRTDRTARFRTSVTLIIGGETFFFDGVLEGHIALSKSGGRGFGYDPVFMPERTASGLNTEGLTLAMLSDKEKNDISHRGKAMRAMAEFLKNR